MSKERSGQYGTWGVADAEVDKFHICCVLEVCDGVILYIETMDHIHRILTFVLLRDLMVRRQFVS